MSFPKLRYRPAPGALDIIGRSPNVQKLDLGSGGTFYVFLPSGNRAAGTGFILYPGGFIDAPAYAPLMQNIADAGYTGVIAAMPLNLAVLGASRAGKIMARFPDIDAWALGGHSLGGVMASRYVKSAQAVIPGLVLLASYPSERFRVDHLPLKAVSIYANCDGLIQQSTIEESRRHLPAGTRFIEIRGGNHSQFCALTPGSLYRGDNPASITPAEQQQAIAGAVADFLGSI
jgi:hypothetical protein